MLRITFPIAWRRMIAVRTLDLLFPYTFRDEQQNVKTMDRYLKAGHGIVVLYPHFSLGDVRIYQALIEQSAELRRRTLLMPVAWHQQGFPGLAALARFTGTIAVPLVTSDTKRKEAELQAAGKPVPWDQQDERHGLRNYIAQAAKVLKDGGIVMVAPQGGRRPTLAPFEGKPVTILDTMLRRAGVDPSSFAYVFLGVEMPGAAKYTDRGLNIRKRYTITLGGVLRADTFRERANAHNHLLDDEALSVMRSLAPDAYTQYDAAMAVVDTETR